MIGHDKFMEIQRSRFKKLAITKQQILEAQQRVEMLESGIDPDDPIEYIIISASDYWDMINNESQLGPSISSESVVCGDMSINKSQTEENVYYIVKDDIDHISFYKK